MKKYSLNMYADAVYNERMEVEAENEQEAKEKAMIEFNKLITEGEAEIDIFNTHFEDLEEIEA